ncbi:hypothetical protein TNCV_4542591 [Trichonephila clavipes]|nr:hypothetical protein TNCV_4542591 [Trichonephila clavipes]
MKHLTKHVLLSRLGCKLVLNSYTDDVRDPLSGAAGTFPRTIFYNITAQRRNRLCLPHVDRLKLEKKKAVHCVC